MVSSTEEFFDSLSQRRHEPMLEKVAGTIRFDVARGGDGGHWLVGIDRGEIRVSRDGGDADCVVRADPAVFDDIVSGRVNAMAAMLRGTLEVEGDPELLVLVQRLFPGPESR